MPRIKEPWSSFLLDVDRELKGPTEVHCLGGFVLGVLWDLPRPTGDVDFIEVRPGKAGKVLLAVAGEGTPLASRHRLHFHRVGIAIAPDDYESRLMDISPPGLQNLSIKALDVHDLVLTKISRNSPRDRADVEFLARRNALDPQLLRERFDAELRPYLLNDAREALTLDLWLEEYFRNEGD